MTITFVAARVPAGHPTAKVGDELLCDALNVLKRAKLVIQLGSAIIAPLHYALNMPT